MAIKCLNPSSLVEEEGSTDKEIEEPKDVLWLSSLAKLATIKID
ncbi:hypothetical protein DB42_AN00020 [Neochlamydia sp. EPS4]|nr:hypothetical protein DB42_AN00020 [Neochlamydia sp. EPS4]